MKNIFKNTKAVLAIVTLLTACTNNNEETISGTGKLGIEFDNAYGSNDLILNTQNNTTSNNEILKIGSVKYIVSNIVLTKEDGTTFTYPKSNSYFIVNESDAASLVLDLENIPAANYTKVKFGIGVDQDQYNLGASGQGSFLAQAQTLGMAESWSEGYKLLAFEGKFISPVVTSDSNFMVQAGQSATTYNYSEVTLDFPTKARVRTDITPEIHIVADVSKIIDGINKIKLSDHFMGGMAMIINGASLPLITTNISSMFTVAHVHND